MNEQQFKRGDRHPDGSERFFWSYRTKDNGRVYEVWVRYEKWSQYAEAHAKKQTLKLGAARAARKREKNLRHTRTCNQTQRILDYLARGKSHSFIMTACNVPASVILEAQKSA